jgi:tryptophanyl-tRNA synthetase
VIVTGLQPTGSIHLGNYLGAVKPLVALQRPAVGSVVMVADYHAITIGHDPTALRDNSLKLAAMLIASGVDHSKSILFKQSAVPAHTELSWILQCTAARTGWLNRMVQFKDKAASLGENSEGPSVGLYTYPVLQAADILLYQADEVPVGEDQSQHLNLAVDIAEKFNREYGQLFTIPKAVITTSVKRIMSLTDPTKKMSKSDSNSASRIDLDDPAEEITKKIKRATTDSELIPDQVVGLIDRPGLTNLLTIYASFNDLTLGEALEQFAGKGFGVLKPAVAESVIEGLRPVQRAYHDLMGDREALQALLERGANSACILADETLDAVRRAIGVVG